METLIFNAERTGARFVMGTFKFAAFFTGFSSPLSTIDASFESSRTSLSFSDFRISGSDV